MKATVLLASIASLSVATAFAPAERYTYHNDITSVLTATTDSNTENTAVATSSRRTFFTQSAAMAAAAATTTTSWFVQPAQAVSGVKKVDAKLLGFGLPSVGAVPDGFSPLLEVWGKGKNRSPLLVTFAHPLSWVVTLPSNNVNGEDGTIQAGDYGKGDTATLYVYTDAGNVGDVTKQPRDLFEKALKRSISQRGDNMYQNFKLTKLEPGTGSYLEGQSYMMADFKYQLLTGAGFEVDRKGVAAITSEGDAVEVLWAASTDARYKKTEATLRKIVASFRCYAKGINFSDELVTFEEVA